MIAHGSAARAVVAHPVAPSAITAAPAITPTASCCLFLPGEPHITHPTEHIMRERVRIVKRIRSRIISLGSPRPLTYSLDMAKRKNPHAVALGRKGGKKGGITTRDRMTPEERSASARRAALARWKKPPPA